MTTQTTPNATLAPESYDEKFDRMKKHKVQTTEIPEDKLPGEAACNIVEKYGKFLPENEQTSLYEDIVEAIRNWGDICEEGRGSSGKEN